MNDVIVVTMMCFICVQFHIFQLVTIHTTTITQFAYACLSFTSLHLPCLDTCDAATSILSAELLKVHLKSVQQNAVHGEKQIIEMNNIKIYFHYLRRRTNIYNNNKMDFQFHQNKSSRFESMKRGRL